MKDNCKIIRLNYKTKNIPSPHYSKIISIIGGKYIYCLDKLSYISKININSFDKTIFKKLSSNSTFMTSCNYIKKLFIGDLDGYIQILNSKDFSLSSIVSVSKRSINNICVDQSYAYACCDTELSIVK